MPACGSHGGQQTDNCGKIDVVLDGSRAPAKQHAARIHSVVDEPTERTAWWHADAVDTGQTRHTYFGPRIGEAQRLTGKLGHVMQVGWVGWPGEQRGILMRRVGAAIDACAGQQQERVEFQIRQAARHQADMHLRRIEWPRTEFGCQTGTINDMAGRTTGSEQGRERSPRHRVHHLVPALKRGNHCSADETAGAEYGVALMVCRHGDGYRCVACIVPTLRR
jgi:hypothetical protein